MVYSFRGANCTSLKIHTFLLQKKRNFQFIATFAIKCKFSFVNVRF